MVFVNVNELKKVYGNITAVNKISFTINNGEIFGLLGPNGAGKTTTISIIATLLKPTSGDVTIDNYSVTKKPHKVREILGYVPQDIALYPTLNARENLTFWGRMYNLNGKELKERVDEVLELVNLTERAKEPIKNYSGGMKRRINIAVGLLHKPKLLVMDEPTVGVDPQSRNSILETVKNLSKEGMTIIYTSHYMEEIESICDTVAIMDNGEIKALDTVNKLKEIVGNENTIKVFLHSPLTAERKTILLKTFNSSIQIKDREIYLTTNDGNDKLIDIISTLQSLDLEIDSVDIIKPNLEKVFLHLTGKSLRD
ncbi:ABC-2 type transport system ATP-binding protein [Anaerobranca californiensis DSM 14826]|jgi:ABC-2 type transport system ATP-binding protein|uniref:ABC-2 type transport system ATP-binding protein n=1 Tax=Anaerobranca californiensis DSM 14826 TaxID=1120989 RepID=A0A1M6QW86_9FIRM|nr:ABC transporter ATP-binding protein [Anaerobranca californiensis]SHK24383.1 ABC-2 type transport system ATP-binding protein [Anaerobranca californiensis DSM 14826]